jgi:hypothetical protein
MPQQREAGDGQRMPTKENPLDFLDFSTPTKENPLGFLEQKHC